MRQQKRRQNDTAVTYTEHIRVALNHFDEPHWLGENSPLSAPYFLGQPPMNVTTQTEDASYRGGALREALLRAADTMWLRSAPQNKEELLATATEARQADGYRSPPYLYLILELRYFRRVFRAAERPFPNNDLGLSDFLGVSRASYFNHLKEAQQQLGEALLKVVQPTLRLEQPPKIPDTLTERDEMQRALAVLQNSRSVAISGASGVGKTVLGSRIATHWPAEAVFWFTLRPSFNDRLSSLLFSLAYFLHRQGASALWQQLIADKGKLEAYNVALAHIRGDLESLNTPPLICVDEIDTLRPNQDQMTVAHTQLLAFLESLQTITPVLLLGQKPTILTHTHIELVNFLPEESESFLNAQLPDVSIKEWQKLHAYTDGNPRLLQLCVALSRAKLPIDEIVKRVPQTPALQALWGRLWRRFSGEERQLLCNLSVFRSPAPEDAWGEQTAVLTQLIQWRIILSDGQGGLSLLPAIRDLIYGDRQRFSADEREMSHLLAAHIRADRGEFTPAAYHFFKAGSASQMIQIWYPNRQLEIERGQGSIALNLFEQLSLRTLPKEEQQALALLRAQLYGLAGQLEEGLATLGSVSWPSRGEVTVEARLLQGDFLNALGQPHRAIERYEEGMDVIRRLHRQMTRYRYRRTLLFAQQRDMATANREASLAQFEVLFLQGILAEEDGRFSQAQTHYAQALELAERTQDSRGLAQTHWAISKIYGRLANTQEATHNAEQAISYFRHIGDRLTEETVRSTLAATFLQAGAFEKAIGAGETAVAFFANAKNSYWEAVTGATLAEAYFEVGKLDEAVQMARRVLSLEEAYTLPYATFTLGLVAQAQGNLAEAEKQFGTSQQLATHNEDHFMAAYAWRSLGEVLLTVGREVEGETAVHQALAQFEALGMTQEVARTQQLLG